MRYIPGWSKWHRINAGLVGLCFPFNTGLFVDDGDGGGGNDRPGSVLDGTVDLRRQLSVDDALHRGRQQQEHGNRSEFMLQHGLTPE
jgi:hypothetical protein